MYHHLCDDNSHTENSGLWSGQTNCSQFEAHMRAIGRRFRVISVESAADEIRYDGCLREDSIAVTFDDGYASVYEIAFPLLKEYGYPATVYLTTDWINGLMIPWWERVRRVLTPARLSGVSKDDLSEMTGCSLSQDISDYAGDRIDANALTEKIEMFLRTIDDGQRENLLSKMKQLLAGSDASIPELPASLNWSQIKEMTRSGILFGAHTRSHINFGSFDVDSIRSEIVDSKVEIEKQLGKEVMGFAYPYGQDLKAYAGAESILSSERFTYACTAISGTNDVFSNLYRLRRITLPQTESQALLDRELMLNLSG